MVWWKEILILIVVVTIFFLSFILNRKTEVPPGTKLPEECQHCQDSFCLMKKGKETIKEEMKAELAACEKEKENKHE